MALKALEQKLGIGIQGKLTGLFILLTLVGLALNAAAIYTLSSQEGDAVVINIAGRQRMLSQKMSKEAIAILGNVEQEAHQKGLKGTYDLFATSHQGLIHGDVKLGLPPTTDPEILTQMNKVDSLWKDFSQRVQVVLDATQSPEAKQEATLYIAKNNVNLLKEMNKAVGLYEQLATAKVKRLNQMLYLGIGFIVFAVMVIYLITLKGLTRPVQHILEVVKNTESGDLTRRLETNLQDEIGQLCNWFNHFLEGIQDMLKDLKAQNKGLRDNSSQLANQTKALRGTAEELSHRTEQQAASTTESASTIQEMASRTQTTTSKVQAIQTKASLARQDAQKGAQALVQMNQSFQKIEESSKRIGGIMNVIVDIASQTNLLSLNAAIEAAKAGESGKGFAVVAEEVRSLAERSSKAVQQIQALIQESTQNIHEGDQVISHAGDNFDQIIKNVGEISLDIDEISSAIVEQDHSLQDVSLAAEEISKISEENAQAVAHFMATIKKIVEATSSLDKISEELNRSMSRFKI